ncbi:MAG: class F sortase [Nitriliruptoraceae bacterium]
MYDTAEVANFVVESSEQTSKDRLPVDTIWPTTDEALLTLITCGGEFDRNVRHYRDNIVVYASS